MQKICFVLPSAYYMFNPKIIATDGNIGGAQKQSFLLSTELTKHNFDVHFCVNDYGQNEIEKQNNVTLWKISNNKALKIIQAFYFFKTLKKINADIYIFRSANIGSSLSILYIKFLLKKRVIYMLASNIETQKSTLVKHKGLATALNMKLVYKFAHYITCQTKEQASLFQQNHKRKPDTIIKNIYPLKNINFTKTEKNTILWVGRLDKVKNAELYIELAQKFPKEHFIMIAPLAKNQFEYGNKIKKNALEIPNIQFIDFVPPNEINRFYKKAKIYIITSDSEGFSNTMAEAMANKCTILSYKVNTDNILSDYKIGYCANGNKNLFFEQFSQLLTHKNLEQFGENGYNYLTKNHDIQSNINILIKLINTTA